MHTRPGTCTIEHSRSTPRRGRCLSIVCAQSTKSWLPCRRTLVATKNCAISLLYRCVRRRFTSHVQYDARFLILIRPIVSIPLLSKRAYERFWKSEQRFGNVVSKHSGLQTFEKCLEKTSSTVCLGLERCIEFMHQTKILED